jgi:hypothetical protein
MPTTYASAIATSSAIRLSNASNMFDLNFHVLFVSRFFFLLTSLGKHLICRAPKNLHSAIRPIFGNDVISNSGRNEEPNKLPDCHPFN